MEAEYNQKTFAKNYGDFLLLEDKPYNINSFK